MLDGLVNDSMHEGTASNFCESSRFEIVSKSLARFSTQFRVKEGFKLLLGDKSRN